MLVVLYISKDAKKDKQKSDGRDHIWEFPKVGYLNLGPFNEDPTI